MSIHGSRICAVASLLSNGVLLVLVGFVVSAEGPDIQSPSTSAKHQSSWRIGMSAAFSGPAEALGNGMRSGIERCFKHVNQQGGVHGRPLELIALDDAYEPSKTAPNMRSLIDRDCVFSIIGNVGTPTAAVAVPIANEKAIPLFGAFTGAGLLRKNPPDRYVINYRASYAEETAEMVRGLVEEIGIAPEEIGFFTQNDAYGDAGWKGAVEALQRVGFVGAVNQPHGRYTRNTGDIEDGLSRLLDPRHKIRAVVMVGAYSPCAKFIKLAKEHDFRPIFLNVSFVGSEALNEALGSEGEGVIVTQVVPLPEGQSAAALEFQSVVPESQRTFVSFEGFLVARAFLKALQACPANADPESLIEVLESGHEFDLGLGVVHRLSANEHQFSHQVWPTIIRNSKFETLNWSDLKAQRPAQ